MHLATHFSTLARYNLWATRRLLEAVAPLDDASYRKDAGLFFKSIYGTLNHLLVGEHLVWYQRFANGLSPKLALDMEAQSIRESLAQSLIEGAANWQPLIATWPAERFEGQLSYTTTKGLAVALPFIATLAHVFNHGTHHRGQITAALTMLGHPCPVLDLVYMLQEESKA
jgi:uncharacterized damage-inducible protein DinB